MKKIICIALMLSFPGFALADSNYIQDLLNERITKNYNVGIVVAVIDGNNYEFYSAGHVSKNNDTSKVDEHTIFPIASITKVFTTSLLAKAINDGKAKLQDPAEKYLSLNWPRYQDTPITLADLATHTSGLTARFGDFTKNDPYANLTDQDVYDFIGSYKLDRRPGSKYEYCDLGIGLLGVILANIYQEPYEQLVYKYITNSLEMHHTMVVPSSKNDKRIIVSGYDLQDKVSPPYQFPILASAGAIYSNAADLAKFVAANITDNQEMKLAHQAIHSQGEDLVDLDFPGLEKLEIGLGWNIDKKHNLIWKNGNMAGFSSFIGFNNLTKKGVVILANTGNVIFTDNLAMHLLNPEIPLFPLHQEIKFDAHGLEGKYYVQDNSYYSVAKEANTKSQIKQDKPRGATPTNVGETTSNEVMFKNEIRYNHLVLQHVTEYGSSKFFNIYPMSKNQYFGRIADAVFTFTSNGCLILKEAGKEEKACRAV
jgi:CubicO group peptidase (beta-lactamase class C family)